MRRQPTADDWRRLCVLLLLQHGGEINIDDALIASMDRPEDYTVAWCKNPTSFSWKVRAYRTPGEEPQDVVAPRELAAWTSPEAKAWRADVAERLARHLAGLPWSPDPAAQLDEPEDEPNERVRRAAKQLPHIVRQA